MIITLASSKGGVGKSTTCACVATALAHQGNRVHIIDLDQNRTLARWAKNHPLSDLDVMAVAPDDFADHLDAKLDVGLYDHILIDIAGVYADTLIFAVGKADAVIIPMQTSEPDLKEAIATHRHIQGIEKTFNTSIPHALLLTAVAPLPMRITTFIEEEIHRLGLPRFTKRIVQRAIYKELFSNGAPPHIADPDGKAAHEINAVITELRALLQKSVQEAAPIPLGEGA
jgi:chromosome partitioning protein